MRLGGLVMGLTKYKIKELITVVYEKNDNGIRDFYDININKEFMPTVANTNDLDETKYKVVRKGRFVYSGMQTGRDECIRLSMYTKDKPIVVSPAYTTFEIAKNDKIVPLYFFIYFLSKEKDRLGWFYSDGSVRANLDWDIFGDIEIPLPSIHIQKKYVNIYNAMVANQQSYERGLQDLKLSIDASIEKFKHNEKWIPLGEMIEESDVRNIEGDILVVHGVNKDKEFMPSVASGADLSKYKIVRKGQFACNLMHVGRDVAVPIALHKEDKPIIISPAYFVFNLKDTLVLPEYAMIWLSRNETDRYAWFLSDTNVRSGMEKKRFCEIEIPIPDIQKQKALVEIYNVYMERRNINEKLKQQIKNLCPILIKGSLKEASV